MDTRSKIVSADAFRPVAGVTHVVASLDPLLAAHAAALDAIARRSGPVTILLADPPDPLLPAAARAELAASLSCVGCVVVGGAALAGSLPPGSVVREDGNDIDRRAWLMRHVASQHAAPRS